MKPSFLLALVFAHQFSFTCARSFLDGELQEDIAALSESRHIKNLKNALESMFKALPKNQHGNLVPQVARYALHRLFEQQHSWSVNGLRAGGADTKEENAFSQLTEDVTPTGISISSLAALAAALEDRIHNETLSQLKTTYESLGLDVSGAEISAEELDVIVNRYMTIYISGMREYSLSKSELADQNKYMETSTQDWPATMKWINDAQQDAVRARKPCGHGITDCTFDFATTNYVVEELLKGYGNFNRGECRRLKSTLLKLEDRKTGRVSLSDFYKEGMSGTWEFNEKIDYLRDLGTLDETVPGHPRVIVTNYVNSWVNCLTSSSLYSVCCRNECEDLMAHLEQHIEVPMATPERILQLVQNFQSADFPGSLSISELSQARLRKIAEKHGGAVPLHGRLFAQWLHHVFPQNCPYPHTAGATNPLTPDEWMKESGHTDIKASHEEILMVVNKFGLVSNAAKEDDGGEQAVPWSDEEEVFVIHDSVQMPQDSRSMFLDTTVIVLEVAITMGLVFSILRVAKAHRSAKAQTFEKVVI